MKTIPLKAILAGVLATATLATVSIGAASAAKAHTSTPTCAATLATKSKSPIHITFWESMPAGLLGGTGPTGNEAAILNLVKAFNTAEKGKIVVTDVNQSGGYGQTWDDYVDSLTNHTSPNVVMFDQYNAQSAEDTRSILPVSTCITNNKDKTTTFNKKVMGGYTSGKTIVGMPFSASVPVMYYNTQALSEAKIKAAPTTMAAVLADQKTLQKTSWSAGGKSGKYTSGVSIKYDPWEITSWAGLDNDLIVNDNNGHTGRANAAVFGQDADLKSYMTDLQQIAKNADGVNVYNPSSTSLSESYGNLFDVANGVSGITFDTTAALGTIMSYLGLYKNVTLGVAPLPTLTGKVTGGMPSGGNGLFINSSNSSAAQEAASWIFIQYLTSATELAKWDVATGYLPIRTDEVTAWKAGLVKQGKSLKQPKLEAWFETGYNSLSAGKTSAATEGPLIGAYDAVNDDMQAALETLLTSPFSTTPAAALSTAASTSTTDIKSYNSGL